MSGHFIDRCECGRVLRQCRCIGPKVENVVSPCNHKPTTKKQVSPALSDAAAAEANGFTARTRSAS